MKKIAPTLQSWILCGNPHPDLVPAVAELRALLAVAVAAQAVANRYQKAWARNANNKDDRLVRCLSRLDKVSHD